MAEDDLDQSVLIIGYEKPWLERSAILINNSFLDAIDESISKENHVSDHENLADEGEQELNLASSTEKSQSSPDQHEYNQTSKTFSRKASRENHVSDHENLADEGEQELKQLTERQVKSPSACLASSTEKSQSSPDQHEYNQTSNTFSKKSSRESQERRGSERIRASKDAKSRSKGEKKPVNE